MVPAELSNRNSREEHEKAVAYYEYVAFIFSDTITTDVEIKTFVDTIARSIGAEKKSELPNTRLPYRILTVIQTESECTEVDPCSPSAMSIAS